MRRRRVREQADDLVMLVPDPGFERDTTPPTDVARGQEYVPDGVDDGGRIGLSEVNESVRRVAGAIRAGVGSATRVKAASGPRPGAITQERRRGGSIEVIQTCHLEPDATERLVVDGSVDRLFVRGMQSVAEPLRCGRADYVWSVTVRTGLLARRHATLHIMPTPSSNLSVLELIPVRSRWFGTRRFVDRGVRSVEELATRMESLAAS